MRSITLMGTAAVVLSATTFMAVPASAERICHLLPRQRARRF
jgi:hypothetical protein